ncbi:hypothetical protein Hanom_Chr11g00982691 [Helianthus anomalus]
MVHPSHQPLCCRFKDNCTIITLGPTNTLIYLRELYFAYIKASSFFFNSSLCIIFSSPHLLLSFYIHFS